MLSLALCAAPLASCGADGGASPLRASVAPSPFESVEPAKWERLASRRIFFGHQSVGRNVLDGVRAIAAERPDLGIRVVATDDPAREPGPALMEARVGKNRDPASKDRAFAAMVARGMDEAGSIAAYKYCYVDVRPDTDVEALFRAYAANVDAVRARHPRLTVVHITLPLMTEKRWTVKERVKRLLGREVEEDLNPRRHRFNELLRARYAGSGTVFDLAALQATRPDGSRSRVPALAPEWASDEGHLNQAGQRHVAEHFLAFLARLP